MNEIETRPRWRAAYAPYFYLFYLGFVFFHHAFRPPSLLYWGFDIAAVLAFLPIWVWSMRQTWQKRWIGAVLMSILGIAVGQYNPGNCTFFIYAATLAGAYPTFRSGLLHVGGVVALLLGWAFIQQPHLWMWAPGVGLSFFIGIGNIFDGMRDRHRDTLLKKQEEIEYLAKVAERERIARDLHDLLGHTLSLITLKAELARKLIDKDIERCRVEVKDIENTARLALQEVRQAVLGIRSSGLAQEYRQMSQALNVAGIELNGEMLTESLPADLENILSFILREAVTNIIRHSGADKAQITLAREAQKIILRVADNGLKPMGATGNGLRGMQERVTSFAGELHITSGKGHVIEVRLPWEQVA